jgi:hypothetical protein
LTSGPPSYYLRPLRYLPRFGMAPRWVSLSRPLVLVLFAVDVVVTWIFDGDVEAQSGAYATGVLVLILSARVRVEDDVGQDDPPASAPGPLSTME